MGEAVTTPVIEGWFTTEGEPALLGSQCKTCNTYFFPKESLFCRNPRCQGREFAEVPLSRRGKIWSFTEHFYQPPAPYVSAEPFEPYIIAAVELEKEKMVVLGQMVAGVKNADLSAGQEVEIVVDDLYQEDDTTYTVWKWKPVAA